MWFTNTNVIDVVARDRTVKQLDPVIPFHFCDLIAVMKDGEFVERADRQQRSESSEHPYIQALLASIPVPDPVVERTRRSTLKADA